MPRSKASHYAMDEELAMEEYIEGPSRLFNELGDSFFFYEDETRAELQKKFAHLVEFTDLVLYLQGPEGCGKTSLLKERFLKNPKQNWQCCYIDCESQNDVGGFFRKFAQDIKVARLDPSNESSAQLFVQQLHDLRQSGIITILLIDNAEKLTSNIFELLRQLVSADDEQRALLRLVMAGTEKPYSLKQHQSKGGEFEINTLHLKPLDLEHVADYLHMAVEQMGLNLDEGFSNAEIKKIYQKSQGRFKLINQHAQSVWTNALQRNQQQDNKRSGLGRKLRLITAVLGVSVIASLVFFAYLGKDFSLDGSSDNNVVQSLEIPRAEKPTSTAAKPESVTAIEKTKIQTPEPAAKIAEEASGSDIFADAIEDALDNHQAAPPQVKQEKPPTQLAKIKPVETPKPDITQTPSTASANKGDIHSDAWLAVQKTSSFTLQLLGSSNRQAVLSFAKDHQLEDQAAMFHTVKNGKDWYSLTYGIYASRAQAQQAANTLPSGVSKKPWIRPISAVHRDMGIEAMASQ